MVLNWYCILNGMSRLRIGNVIPTFIKINLVDMCLRYSNKKTAP